MTYVDGFMSPVPAGGEEAYLAHARLFGAILKENGALQVVETWGDDLPEGTVNSMHTAVLRGEDEAVVFSWIVWPDKATRDAAWAAMMQDPRLAPDRAPMPFDGKRMIWGGFRTILDL